MGHLLYDAEYIFDIKPITPFGIYHLIIDNEIYTDNFLPIDWVITYGQIDEKLLMDIARTGNFKCLHYLNTKSCLDVHNCNICRITAKYGHPPASCRLIASNMLWIQIAYV